jgi:hypothetical protein
MTVRRSIAAIADEILAEVESEERIKVAEIAAIHAATPKYMSETGELLHKVAEDLRVVPSQVTYNDLEMFLGAKQ